MSTTTSAPPLPAATPRSARLALALLGRMPHGSLDLQRPDGLWQRLGQPQRGAPVATIRLHDWAACDAALRAGDIGFAEAYIEGRWSSPDLPGLLKLLVAQREHVEALVYGRWWGALAYRLRHLLNRNSRRGSRRNIHAHYDIGNDFYRLWLDETMNYSSAWFAGDRRQPLAAAQGAKMRRALTACGLAPGQRLLEIGCGWGALAELAARDFGAQVTGLTLSTEQLGWARRRLAAAGLAERAELRLQDWRDLGDGPYDAVCSIEMFEAVGREYWPAYFAQVHRSLVPGGRACIQTITIRDDLYPRYLRSTDFIQQYIFPGGLLPSAAAFRAEAGRAGLRVVDELAFGSDYAETLARWRAAFLRREAEVRALGLDTRFLRTWDFYLAYCEAAFAGGNTDVVQFTLQRG
jgi:cyclopropane-fatty-acyl-phospholipid synthase